VLSEKTLGYAKVSYNTGTVQAESGASSVSKDISGTGFGFGVRTLLSKNLYLQVEANRIQFDSARFADDTSDFKTTATVGTVGIGYKF
jgi:opacity protein-like surface antigen